MRKSIIETPLPEKRLEITIGRSFFLRNKSAAEYIRTKCLPQHTERFNPKLGHIFRCPEKVSQ